MVKALDGRMRRVEVKARITEDLYNRLVEECWHCGCSHSGVIAIAIAREIGHRKAVRFIQEGKDVLVGQIDIEGNVNA